MAPRQIAVALYHRPGFSEGRMRQVFSHEAYHWGILVVPVPGPSEDGQDPWVFEATDVTEIDPVTFRMHNPTMDWWLRAKRNIDPEPRCKLLGIVILGQTPEGLSYAEMKGIMDEVPLPVRNKEPQQSCVTWVESAIRTLQSRGWIGGLEMDQFKDWALDFADERMKGEDSRQPETVQYHSP